MESASVSVDSLGRSFGSIRALDGIDIDLTEPEIVGLVGPNGAGKTTLIRCLLGLLPPTHGTVLIDGTPAASLSSRERAGIGYMPQGEALYRDLTIRENVEFFAAIYGIEDRTTAVDEALSVVNLTERETDRVKHLSGGMIRRASLACTLVSKPAIMLLDEPTVGVDPQLRAELWSHFRQWRDDGALVIVSTHYLGEADNCDRVLFLRDGQVLRFADPQAILAETKTASLEAAFVSMLNDQRETVSAAAAPPRGHDGNRGNR